MQDPVKHEQKHLEKTIEPIKEEKIEVKKELKKLEKDYEEGIKEIAKEGRLDEKMEMLGALNKTMSSRSYEYKREKLLKRLESQVNNPYFARIDYTFKGDKHSSTFYIGRYAYLPSTQYKIIDWRSPVASLYYNYNEPTENAKYSFILEDYGRRELKEVEGSIDLRRNLEIEKSKILAIYDNSLRVNLLATKIKEKSGGVLKDIVETIQHTQNLIIREDPYKVCIIQGTAGSGKTTISIHRISYILYTYKEEIKENNFLLFSSSKVLINYITSTLPELEIFALERDTLESYLYRTLNQNNFKLSKQITEKKDKHSIEKNKMQFINYLKKYCEEVEKDIVKELQKQHFYTELNYNTAFTRMGNLPLFERIKTVYTNTIGRQKDLTKELNKGNYTVEDELYYIDEAVKFLRNLNKEVEPIHLYGLILAEYNRKQGTSVKFNKNKLNIDDLSALFIIARHFYRTTYNEKQFKQIVVDEAQDMGLINYYAIKNIYSYNKIGYTILGDLNQSTKEYGKIQSWEDLDNIFNKEQIQFYEIKISYRTTKQIVDIARKVLSKIPDIKHLPHPFERDGEEPTFEKFTNKKDLIKKIANQVRELRKNGDDKAIGIIETDHEHMQETHKELIRSKVECKIIDDKFENFNGSDIYLVSEKLVKGLEFDTVFIIDPNNKEFKVEQTDAKRLFVCITRAINNLYIYSFNPLSKLLA